MLRHPFIFILCCLMASIFLYGMALIFSSNNFAVELSTNLIFLIGCLIAVIIAFIGKHSVICKGAIVLLAIVCWVFVFRGYIFSSYYDKELENWANEQRKIGDRQWEKERRDAK